jgi:hypothetical protein
MQWLSDLIDHWYDKSDDQKKAEEVESITASGKKIVSNMKNIGDDYDDIRNTDVKKATAELLTSIGIKMSNNNNNNTTGTTP